QLERPLRAGRFDPRALCAAPAGGRPEQVAKRGRRQSRSGQDLVDLDGKRKARRPWRAFGRGRHHRHGGVGRGRQDRRQAAVSTAGRAPQAQRRSSRIRLRRRRLLYPGKDLSMLRGEMRGYLDRGYSVVKMKIGGASIAEDRARIEAVLKEIGSEAQ